MNPHTVLIGRNDLRSFRNLNRRELNLGLAYPNSVRISKGLSYISAAPKRWHCQAVSSGRKFSPCVEVPPGLTPANWGNNPRIYALTGIRILLAISYPA